MRRVVIVCSVVVVALVAGGGWWFTRDTAPPPMSVDDVAASGSGGSAGAGSAGLDGTWSVAKGSDSQAGLRIVEDRFGGLRDNTAVGRTTAVTGSAIAEGRTVSKASFTVDLSKVRFSDDPGLDVANRSTYLRTKSLETDTYPNATFTLTEPIRLSRTPADGATVTASATGTLTLHGVDKRVTFDVDAKVDGSRVVLATAKPVPVKLADYGIDAPEITGLSKVRGTGQFEFVVVLRRG